MLPNHKYSFTVILIICIFVPCECFEIMEFFGPKLKNHQESRRINESAQLIPVKLAKRFGYHLESHEIVTATGYILTIHRLPKGRRKVHAKTKRKQIVFISHGLLASSDMWLTRGPEEDLPYLLADNGYDVWLYNMRGNFYSRHHQFYDSDRDKHFWNFGIEDSALVDLPKTIDYILENTGEKNLFFIGHSMGVSTALILCSSKPEYNQKIKFLMALSPLATVKQKVNPMHRFLFDTLNALAPLLEEQNIYEILPRRSDLHKFIASACGMLQNICTNLLSVLLGGSFDRTAIMNFLTYYPSGTSLNVFKGIFHYYLTHKFSPFANKNDSYDLSKVTVPVSLHYCTQDFLVREEDVDELMKQLPNPIGKFRVADGNCSHLDVVIATNARQIIYDKLLTIIKDNN